MRSAAFDDLVARARAVPIEREIERRGIRLKSSSKIGRAGPCPVCGGRDRFWINTSKQCFGCRGCNVGGDVIALVKHVDDIDFKTAIETLTRDGPRPAPARAAAPPRDAEEYEKEQHRKAAWFWSQRRPIARTPAEIYLREARKIMCKLPPTLGFLPPAKPEHHPAMVAAFALAGCAEPGILAAPREVGSVHLTLLKPDGSGKADVENPKRIVGRPLGRPIALALAPPLTSLVITEGIEDGLTAHEATGLGAWAAGSAPHMPKLAELVPRHIEVVTICAHNDKSGRRGALGLADALVRRGVEVFIEGLPR